MPELEDELDQAVAEVRRHYQSELLVAEELVVRRDGSDESTAARVEIVLRSGVVRVGAGFDETTLRRVIAVLEGSR